MSQPNMTPVNMNNNAEDENNGDNINFNDGTNYFGNEELDSAFTSENQDGGGSVNDQDGRNKRKRYHRHTRYQIQEMEAFFKECPHPDEKQRKELSLLIDLDHLQIKFWFQNKRTQTKNQQERQENTQLRDENERLRADNHRFQEAIANALCPNCGGSTAIGEMSFEEHHLRLENARLLKEMARFSAVIERFIGKPIMRYPLTSPPVPSPPPFEFVMENLERNVYANGGNLSPQISGGARPLPQIIRVADAAKPMIIELAVEAMEELVMMAQLNEPLWIGAGVNGTSLALNLDEYERIFRNGLGPRLDGFRTEASRETAVVAMNAMNIVNTLMIQKQWSATFAGMVARTMTHEILPTRDEAFHLITAEFQVLSPLVPSRESYFVRYCKKLGDGSWAVVDVSIDHFVPNLELKCRRRPSGCLIQETPNGFSKVTWVEHVEVDDREGLHNMYKQLISSGQALGANRWLATLDRRCERLASIMAINSQRLESDGLINLSNHGKKQILKLAERMFRTFFNGVTPSTVHRWCVLSDGAGEDIKVMTSKNLNDPGRPTGLVLCAVTSFWVPVPPKTVFAFLSDEKTRAQWDVISTGGIVQKIQQIRNGRDGRNNVSVLRTANTNHNKMMMIQESSTDQTASFVIYAPVDIGSIDVVLAGGDSDYVPLLPMGFAIFPDGTAHPGGEGGGSLLTLAFQMLVESIPTSRLTVSSVATVENLVRATVDKIKALSPCYIA